MFGLVSTSDYIICNVNIARHFGLEAAVYLQELINQESQAIAQHNVTDEGFVVVNRKVVEEKTTIAEKTQHELDRTFIDLNFLTVSKLNPNEINIDLTQICNLIECEMGPSVSKDAKVIKTRPNRKCKEDVYKDLLRAEVNTTSPELRDAYAIWIDTVIEKQGWMSKASIINAQKLIDSESGRNLDVALEILQIAAINGYRDIQWAINSYRERKPSNPQFKLQRSVTRTAVKLDDEVF